MPELPPPGLPPTYSCGRPPGSAVEVRIAHISRLREKVLRSLDAQRARGNDYEVIDGDAISDEQRSEFYGQAFLALARGGNRYRIRQVFVIRRHGGGDFLGTSVPALLIFDDGNPVDVYPRRVGDGYETIRGYLRTL